jgi:hypothetical protein
MDRAHVRRVSRVLRVGAVAVFFLSTILTAVPAEAHGSCSLDAGRNLAFPGGSAGAVQGWAKATCTDSHHRMDAQIRLQMKWNGSWETLKTGNDSQCCDRKNWTVFTPWCDAFLYNNLPWRVYVDYFHIWNSNNVIAHSWPSGVYWSGTLDVVEAC